MQTVKCDRKFSDGRRDFYVSGAPHPITYRPNDSRWNAPSLSWPARDPRDGSWMLRSARLDWHRKVAKAETLRIIAG